MITDVIFKRVPAGAPNAGNIVGTVAFTYNKAIRIAGVKVAVVKNDIRFIWPNYADPRGAKYQVISFLPFVEQQGDTEEITKSKVAIKKAYQALYDKVLALYNGTEENTQPPKPSYHK